jgi:hypothetical protein
MSVISQQLEATAGRRWALWLMVATGCSSRSVLNLHATDSSVSSGEAGLGGASGAGGNGETGGSVGRGGTPDVGGDSGRGGLASTGGVARTGGTGGTGGVVGSGGTLGGAAGGSSGGGTAGGTGSGVYGLPCTTNRDCPSDTICCDGSDPGCDGTRLPTGDGGTPGEFVVSADGLTVTDTITGLIWQQDNYGPRAGCTAPTPDECSLEEAQAYCASLALDGVSGWRVPAWKELVTLIDVRPMYGIVDPYGFPGNPYGSWTSSLNAGKPKQELYVDLGDGTSQYCAIDYRMVLCVRGSRCYPKARFVVLDGELVLDRLTGLVWQQQGGTTKMTWADAQSYCSSLGSGFRLPTLRELDSLVDPTTSQGPTLDKAFPSTGKEKYWTSSPFVQAGAAARYARYGDFSSMDSNDCMRGSSQNWSLVTDSHMVRCVR